MTLQRNLLVGIIVVLTAACSHAQPRQPTSATSKAVVTAYASPTPAYGLPVGPIPNCPGWWRDADGNPMSAPQNVLQKLEDEHIPIPKHCPSPTPVPTHSRSADDEAAGDEGNMAQIGVALEEYAQDHDGHFPSGEGVPVTPALFGSQSYLYLGVVVLDPAKHLTYNYFRGNGTCPSGRAKYQITDHGGYDLRLTAKLAHGPGTGKITYCSDDEIVAR